MAAQLAVVGVLTASIPLAGLIAPLAHAGGRTVAGAGSFNNAPLITPGDYRDTILDNETLFYAVRLEPGQRLLVYGGERVRLSALSESVFPVLRIHGPLRNDQTAETKERVGSGTSLTRDYRQAAATRNAVGADEPSIGQNFNGGGTWYIRLSLGALTPQRRESQVGLRVIVSGTPQPGALSLPPAGAEAKPPPAPEPSDEPRSERRPRSEQPGRRSPVPALVAAGTGGLLAGALVGAALMAMRRRSGKGDRNRP